MHSLQVYMKLFDKSEFVCCKNPPGGIYRQGGMILGIIDQAAEPKVKESALTSNTSPVA